jgi:hypothetical protein
MWSISVLLARAGHGARGSYRQARARDQPEELWNLPEPDAEALRTRFSDRHPPADPDGGGLWTGYPEGAHACPGPSRAVAREAGNRRPRQPHPHARDAGSRRRIPRRMGDRRPGRAEAQVRAGGGVGSNNSEIRSFGMSASGWLFPSQPTSLEGQNSPCRPANPAAPDRKRMSIAWPQVPARLRKSAPVCRPHPPRPPEPPCRCARSSPAGGARRRPWRAGRWNPSPPSPCPPPATATPWPPAPSQSRP